MFRSDTFQDLSYMSLVCRFKLQKENRCHSTWHWHWKCLPKANISDICHFARMCVFSYLHCFSSYNLNVIMFLVSHTTVLTVQGWGRAEYWLWCSWPGFFALAPLPSSLELRLNIQHSFAWIHENRHFRADFCSAECACVCVEAVDFNCRSTELGKGADLKKTCRLRAARPMLCVPLAQRYLGFHPKEHFVMSKLI